MSLRTGTELSTLALLLNKVSGLYGLLALLTGIHLSPLQFSMYIYSVLALILVVLLTPHIRTQSPFHCLALATFFLLDTIVNAAYTAVFAVTWFLVLSQHHSESNGSIGGAGKMMGDAAGFTTPEYNVSKVEVAVGPDQGISAGGARPEALIAGSGEGQAVSAGTPSFSHGIWQPESMSSIVVILLLWAVRVYFVLVVMSYAKLVLRRHVMATTGRSVQVQTGSRDVTLLENPFGAHLPEGKGWKGRLGRIIVGTSPGFWLGADEDVDQIWGDDVPMGRVSRKSITPVSPNPEAPGVTERERRRRSGTV